MKKNLLYALTAVAMLTGCAKSDVVDSEINKEGNLIGFSTYKNISRGNPVDDNSEFLTKGNTFGVTAFINTEGVTSPYMGITTEGIEIISDGTKWTYANTSDQAYWPTKDETLDFYAYAPYNHPSITTKTFDKANGLTLEYTVPAEEAKQVDLMYASALEQTKPTDKNSVTLPFKHALTQVHFKVGTKTTNLKVDIAANGIQIHNLKNSGSLTMKSNQIDDAAWTLTGDATAKYTVTSDAVTGDYTDGTEANPYTEIGNANNALMLLPQEFVAGDGTAENTGAYLTISCKIYQVLLMGQPKSTYMVTLRHLLPSQLEFPVHSLRRKVEKLLKFGKETRKLLTTCCSEPVMVFCSLSNSQPRLKNGNLLMVVSLNPNKVQIFYNH